MTDTITLPRSVVEQALEDLEMTINYVQSPTRREDMRDSIEALRAALGQPQVKQESVTRNGWVLREVLFDNGEPVGHREPQPARQPLTDEEINNMDVWLRDIPFWRVLKLSRAIEAAHGIGGEA